MIVAGLRRLAHCLQVRQFVPSPTEATSSEDPVTAGSANPGEVRLFNHKKADVHLGYQENVVYPEVREASNALRARRHRARQRLIEEGRIPSADECDDAAEGSEASPSGELVYAASSLCSR